MGFVALLVESVGGRAVGEVVRQQGDGRHAHRWMCFQTEGDDGNEYEEDGNDLDGLMGRKKGSIGLQEGVELLTLAALLE